MAQETRTYSLVIDYDRDEDGYRAYFPALQGCHSWGHTFESAIEGAEEALVGYLAALEKNGKKAPVEKRRAAGVSLGLVVAVPIIV